MPYGVIKLKRIFYILLTTTGERFRFRVSATRFLMFTKEMERSQFPEKK